MYFVCNGTGTLHTRGKEHPLAAGDVFFSFPGSPFCISSSVEFSYMYVSFLGTRSNMIMDKLKISERNCLFHGYNELSPIWENGINTNPELTDWISESILLYTFTEIGNRLCPTSKKTPPENHIALQIKKYIDDNFSSSSFSLESISRELSYNKKYLSTAFKNYMRIGIVEYLNIVRIQSACTLIEQGFTSVSDIASCCGFSDPQYFSKVFKNRMSMSPTQYIHSKRLV